MTRRSPTPTRYRRGSGTTTPEDAERRARDIARGIDHLRRALVMFRLAPAPATACYVRRCIKSAQGAARHAAGLRYHTQQEPQS